MFLSILSTYPWADDSPYLLKKRKEKTAKHSVTAFRN